MWLRPCWKGEVQREIIKNKSPLVDVDHEHARPNKCCFCEQQPLPKKSKELMRDGFQIFSLFYIVHFLLVLSLHVYIMIQFLDCWVRYRSNDEQHILLTSFNHYWNQVQM